MTRASRGSAHSAVRPLSTEKGGRTGRSLPRQLWAADKHSDVKSQTQDAEGGGEKSYKSLSTSLRRRGSSKNIFSSPRGRGEEENCCPSSCSRVATLVSVSTRRESGQVPAPTPRARRCGRRSRCAGRSVGARPAAPGSGRTASSRTGGGSSRMRVA